MEIIVESGNKWFNIFGWIQWQDLGAALDKCYRNFSYFINAQNWNKISVSSDSLKQCLNSFKKSKLFCVSAAIGPQRFYKTKRKRHSTRQGSTCRHTSTGLENKCTYTLKYLEQTLGLCDSTVVCKSLSVLKWFT